MTKNNRKRALSELLVAREKINKPLTEEYIQEKTREIFGQSEISGEELKSKIQDALKNSVRYAKEGA